MQNLQTNIDIPAPLIEAIQNGSAILFLGSGASIGATHPEAQKIPTTKELKQILCEKFLTERFLDRTLAEICQFCESEVGRMQFQQHIFEIFKDFGPNTFHKLIPQFRWHAIITTNFDLIVERAYQQANQKLQELIPFYKDNMQIEAEMKKSSQPLQYLKLHGCISQINDESIPLILTQEQYTKYRNSRTRIFGRLEDWAQECPIIFCGYSISDPNVRMIFKNMFDDPIARHTYYVVQPSIESIEENYWIKNKIHPLKCSFEKFLTELDRSIPKFKRHISSLKDSNASSLKKHYAMSSAIDIQSTMDFITHDVIHVHSQMKSETNRPIQYYKGYDLEFDAIINDFDVPRVVNDTVIADVVLTDETDRENVELFVLTGAAGNGKTNILKRVAYESATQFDALVLYLRDSGTIRTDQIESIAGQTRERIYLFVDHAAMYVREISECIRYCKVRSIRLTIVTAERVSEWNTRCELLDQWVNRTYPIRYFSEAEVHKLLAKLEKHNALGMLADLSYEKRVSEIVDHAKRQILVALHEATQGKPFEQIIYDEYARISPINAKSLYLDICTLNRFDLNVRAGLVSRISGIRFEKFNKDFFKPLENVVYARYDRYCQDYVYCARHPHIAELVFEQALPSVESRYDQLEKILSGINEQYSSDNEALRRIVNGRQISEDLSSIEVARKFFDLVHKKIPNNPHVYHQAGILELVDSGGDIIKAESSLVTAQNLAPNDYRVSNSIAQLLRKRALVTNNKVARQEYRRKALSKLGNSTSNRVRGSYDLSTRLRILIDQLEDIISSKDEDQEQDAKYSKALIGKMREIESQINVGSQLFPNDEHIMARESEYLRVVDRIPEAVNVLKRAFEANPSSDWIGVGLAKLLSKTHDKKQAKQVLQRVLQENPSARDAHYRLALLYANSENEAERQRVLQHLRSSFTDGDSNFQIQFLYARELFLQRQFKESNRRFKDLRRAEVPAGLLYSVQKSVRDNTGRVTRFDGVVSRREETYVLVKPNVFDTEIIAHISESESAVWDDLRRGTAVTFELGFTYRSAVAINLRMQ